MPALNEGTKQAIISAESEKVGGFVAARISLPMLQGWHRAQHRRLHARHRTPGCDGRDCLPDTIGRRGRLCATRPQSAVPIEDHGRALLAKPFFAAAAAMLQQGRNPTRSSTRIDDQRVSLRQSQDRDEVVQSVDHRTGAAEHSHGRRLARHSGPDEIGIIVAVIVGVRAGMTGPARDLLNFYRRLSMMRMQYRLAWPTPSLRISHVTETPSARAIPGSRRMDRSTSNRSRRSSSTRSHARDRPDV